MSDDDKQRLLTTAPNLLESGDEFLSNHSVQTIDSLSMAPTFLPCENTFKSRAADSPSPEKIVETLTMDYDESKNALPNENGSTIIEATFNFTNSIIGAGIIGMPYAFAKAGFFTGLVLLVFLAWIVDWTVGLLVKNAKVAGRQTYQGLIWYCFGKHGLLFISLFQFLYAFGAVCAYQVIIGDTLPSVFSHVISESNFMYSLLSSRYFMIVFCSICISLPLSLYRDLSKLSKASLLSLIAMIFIIIAVIVRGPSQAQELLGNPDNRFNIISPGIFEAIGIISFAFVCHHNSLMIYLSLKRPTLDSFSLVTHYSVGLSFLCCFILAVGGFTIFAEKSQANILNNFPSTDIVINIARICFAANMFLTIPLECFVCREVLFQYFFTSPSDSPPKVQYILDNIPSYIHVLTTFGIILSAMFIALSTCDLGIVLEITGGLSATMIAFILPPACYLKVSNQKILQLNNAGPILCIAFGVVVAITSSILVFIKASQPSVTKNC